MPIQTLTLDNFGAEGYLPDTAPNLLSKSGFSYSRNWRFGTDGFATVSPGYTDAFSTREAFGQTYQFSNPNANLSFLYTWELSEDNAMVVYDANVNRLVMIENGSLGNLNEHNLSVQNDLYYTSQYQGFTQDPAAGNFTINAEGQLIVHFSGSVGTGFVPALIQGNEIAFVDDGRNKPSNDPTIMSSMAQSGDIHIITFREPLSPAFFVDGTSYTWRLATPIFHDDLSLYRWNGVDALGVPIFHNPRENPWQFFENVGNAHPKVIPLTNWPTGARCESFTSFGAVLVAIGYTNLGAMEAGSSWTVALSTAITSAGEFPDWDFRELESDATIIDLSLISDGPLTSAYESNNRLIVNSTTDVVAIVQTGDPVLLYNGTRLEIGGGTLTSKTSVPIPNGFFNIGNGIFYIHDTTAFQEIGHGKYSRTWFETVDPARLDEIQVAYDARLRTVWIKTPTGPETQEIWVLDIENNYSLSVLDDHQEINFFEWSADGTPARSESWDTITSMSWDTIEENSWNDFPITELGEYRNRMLSCGGRQVFVHDFGATYNGRTIDAVLEKDYFKLGAQDSYSSFQFDRVIPWAHSGNQESNTLLSIRVGTSESVGSGISQTPYRNYIIGTTSKLDFRKLGRWGSITFRCQTPGVQLSGVEIQVNSANKR